MSDYSVARLEFGRGTASTTARAGGPAADRDGRSRPAADPLAEHLNRLTRLLLEGGGDASGGGARSAAGYRRGAAD